MKNLLRSTLLLAAVSLALTGCGLKKGAENITGPGGGGVPTNVNFDFKIGGSTPSTMRATSPMAVNVDIGTGPSVGDSMFVSGPLADPLGDPNISWQARRFAGILLANGSLDRPFTVPVPNEQRDYEFAISFKHEGIEYQYHGPVSVNGQYLSAWNYNKYVLWRVFRYLPGGAIDPIRDDSPMMMWTEAQVTGILHPDSTQYNQPVSGSVPLWFLSTDTRLDSNPGVYVEAPAPASWRFPIFAKKGETFLMRAHPYLGHVDGKPTFGNSVLPGFYFKNADNTLTQAINLFDLDPGSGTYNVFEIKLGMDGKWVNPRPTSDERYGWIVIGR